MKGTPGRTLAVAVLLLLATVCLAGGSVDQQFAEHVQRHGRRYGPGEHAARLAVFRRNAREVARRNEQFALAGRSLRLGLRGPYADWAPEEFRQRVLMPPRSADDGACEVAHGGGTPATPAAPIPAGALQKLPTSFDWRDHGAVGPVRDQGSVGTCWAFSTVQNAAGQAYLAGQRPLTELAPEQLNDCDPLDCGVFGGWPCRAMQYAIAVGGLMAEAKYPYCAGTGACYPCQAPGTNVSFCGPGPSYCNATQWPCRAHAGSQFATKLRGWTWFKNENETAIQYRLQSTGPLSILMDASELQWYEGGVFEDPLCSPTALDHAVLLVGWGVESDLLGTYPYWLVKNSWGTDWGLDGYFKLIRDPASLTGPCGMATNVITAIVDQ